AGPFPVGRNGPALLPCSGMLRALVVRQTHAAQAEAGPAADRRADQADDDRDPRAPGRALRHVVDVARVSSGVLLCLLPEARELRLAEVAHAQPRYVTQVAADRAHQVADAGDR